MRPSLPSRAYWQPETNRYVDRREVKASYWKNGRMSPGLLRARRRFRTRNALVGVVLLTFVVGVFSYSMAAVKQDTFDDLDDAVKDKAIMDAKRAALSVEDEKRAMRAAAAFANAPAASASPALQESPSGGVLASMKNMVWGRESVKTIDT
ncbi:hypothetical protein DFH07DRAFT_60058 [Mycena maculata]|uniref:Cytochrome c oxidase assembly factor 3 n=1 Tax=Mycena maculata TaxID=230809 RepID=A0AAD7IDX1_9AGAR|nr:hypothetical protein DFH07DRAFT_60058 [Mycena maculata]